MGDLVRLRVELADVPGALARAASVIADHGGNIVALDVQHAEDASVVDEITIELVDMNTLSKLRRALDAGGVGHVLALQAANAEDLLVRVLRRVRTLLDTPAEEGELALRRGVAELCATPAVWISQRDEAATFAAGREALANPGDAVVVRTEDRLPLLAQTVSGAAWMLAVADPGTPHVVFVARPLAKPFTTTEISRVETLISLYKQIVALRRAGQQSTASGAILGG